MSVPKSVIKFKKNGIVYTSSVDRVQYTLVELTRAALRDVGKYVVRTCNSAAMKLPGLRKSRRLRSRRGKKSAFWYEVPWAKKGLPHVEISIEHGTWYGEQQELGTQNQPKRGILRNSVYNNIPTIVEIESKYLSALEDEATALRLIESEQDYKGGADE